MPNYPETEKRREAVELALQAYRNGADGGEDLLDVAKSIYDYIYGEPVVGEAEAPQDAGDDEKWSDDGESPRINTPFMINTDEVIRRVSEQLKSAGFFEKRGL